MNQGQFTDQAAILWSLIPKEARTKILANVFCTKCCDVVTIAKFKAKEQQGDIYLEGPCGQCGNPVVRVIETSERDNSKIDGPSSGHVIRNALSWVCTGIFIKLPRKPLLP